MSDTAASERNRLRLLVKRLSWASQLSDRTLDRLLETGEVLEIDEGEVIHEPSLTLNHAFFVILGRLQTTVFDLFDKEIGRRQIQRGNVFGLFSSAHEGQGGAHAAAAEPTTVLKIESSSLLSLAAELPELQTCLYQLAGRLVRQLVAVDRIRDQPITVSIVHQTEATRKITVDLATRLRSIEPEPCIAGDHVDGMGQSDMNYQSLFPDNRLISQQTRKALLEELAPQGRVLLDFNVNHTFEDLIQLITASDLVLWCMQPKDATDGLKMIQSFSQRVEGWKDKICPVWLLSSQSPHPPAAPQLRDQIAREFCVSYEDPAKPQGSLAKHGIQRIIQYLRGVQIGIALGGGAARGMAHLGILKTLEQAGIYVDRIAGTSAGAMVGTLYAAGIEVDYTTRSFKKDLKLPWLFQKLPGGGYWYLVYKYRRNQFDPMLRKYLGNLNLEQLILPMSTVTVDLVSGGPMVRTQGDATMAILESINLPVLSPPIIHGGAALVDGGLVNNIPADVLVNQGCNFVIASSVTAKLEREFLGIRAGKTGGKRPSASALKVILRGQLVQSFNMNAVGVQPADYILEPDVTSFDLSEFERADEMAEIGEETAQEGIAPIKQLLNRLDPKLFPTC